MKRSAPHRIVAVAYPGMSPFELSIVIEVFALPRPELDVHRWYAVDVCAVRPGVQPAVGGISITVPHGVDCLADADTVIVPGWPVHDDVPAALIDAVAEADRRGARIVSICSGHSCSPLLACWTAVGWRRIGSTPIYSHTGIPASR